MKVWRTEDFVSTGLHKKIALFRYRIEDIPLVKMSVVVGVD